MGDLTPTERVVAAFDDCLATVLEYVDNPRRIDARNFMAERLVAFLREHPDLLFDLAVEAGVLEETGKAGCTEHSDCRGGDHEWFFRFDDANDLDEDHPIWPVYRRVNPSKDGES